MGEREGPRSLFSDFLNVCDVLNNRTPPCVGNRGVIPFGGVFWALSCVIPNIGLESSAGTGGGCVGVQKLSAQKYLDIVYIWGENRSLLLRY